MRIRKLDQQTSKQIAAGEVVENPSSVVKELVENSLDAGAKRIEVMIKKGGLGEITVLDDGSGVPADEVRLALERHATSKITCLEDLYNIYTLGFRGEALPSIASVSRLSVSTRYQKEETGRYIFWEGGMEKESKEIGFPTGTRITVKDLFYNTPVRLKFLKSSSSETAKISRIIIILALSRPDVSFLLKNENRVLLEIPGDESLLNVIAKGFGTDLARELIPIDFKSGELLLSGYVSKPTYSRNSRHYQLFYINGRYVRSQTIREALDKSFASIITSKRYPAAFLYLRLPAEKLDVNVHPSKVEVRFHQEEQLRFFLEKSLKKAFSTEYFVPKIQKRNMQKEKPLSLTEKDKNGDSHDYKKAREYEGDRQKNLQITVAESHENMDVDDLKSSILNTELYSGRFSNGLIKGQVFSTYIVVQKEDNLIFIDQHAAHERILWEKITQKEKENYVQEILPLPLEFPLQMVKSIRDKLGYLKEIGLEVEQFGNNTFIIRSVPFFLKDIFTAETLRDILEELSGMATADFKKETLLSLSCKAAIKANKRLTPEEINSLLAQLEKCENPFFCPHGRPVAIKIEKSELEKYFKRRG